MENFQNLINMPTFCLNFPSQQLVSTHHLRRCVNGQLLVLRFLVNFSQLILSTIVYKQRT